MPINEEQFRSSFRTIQDIFDHRKYDYDINEVYKAANLLTQSIRSADEEDTISNCVRILSILTKKRPRIDSYYSHNSFPVLTKLALTCFDKIIVMASIQQVHDLFPKEIHEVYFDFSKKIFTTESAEKIYQKRYLHYDLYALFKKSQQVIPIINDTFSKFDEYFKHNPLAGIQVIKNAVRDLKKIRKLAWWPQAFFIRYLTNIALTDKNACIGLQMYLVQLFQTEQFPIDWEVLHAAQQSLYTIWCNTPDPIIRSWVFDTGPINLTYLMDAYCKKNTGPSGIQVTNQAEWADSLYNLKQKIDNNIQDHKDDTYQSYEQICQSYGHVKLGLGCFGMKKFSTAFDLIGEVPVLSPYQQSNEDQKAVDQDLIVNEIQDSSSQSPWWQVVQTWNMLRQSSHMNKKEVTGDNQSVIKDCLQEVKQICTNGRVLAGEPFIPLVNGTRQFSFHEISQLTCPVYAYAEFEVIPTVQLSAVLYHGLLLRLFAMQSKVSKYHSYTLNFLCQKPRLDTQQGNRTIALYEENNECIAIVTNTEGLSKTRNFGNLSAPYLFLRRVPDYLWSKEFNSYNVKYLGQESLIIQILSDFDHAQYDEDIFKDSISELEGLVEKINLLPKYQKYQEFISDVLNYSMQLIIACIQRQRLEEEKKLEWVKTLIKQAEQLAAYLPDEQASQFYDQVCELYAQKAHLGFKYLYCAAYYHKRSCTLNPQQAESKSQDDHHVRAFEHIYTQQYIQAIKWQMAYYLRCDPDYILSNSEALTQLFRRLTQLCRRLQSPALTEELQTLEKNLLPWADVISNLIEQQPNANVPDLLESIQAFRHQVNESHQPEDSDVKSQSEIPDQTVDAIGEFKQSEPQEETIYREFNVSHAGELADYQEALQAVQPHRKINDPRSILTDPAYQAAFKNLATTCLNYCMKDVSHNHQHFAIYAYLKPDQPFISLGVISDEEIDYLSFLNFMRLYTLLLTQYTAHTFDLTLIERQTAPSEWLLCTPQALAKHSQKIPEQLCLIATSDPHEAQLLIHKYQHANDSLWTKVVSGTKKRPLLALFLIGFAFGAACGFIPAVAPALLKIFGITMTGILAKAVAVAICGGFGIVGAGLLRIGFKCATAYGCCRSSSMQVIEQADVAELPIENDQVSRQAASNISDLEPAQVINQPSANPALNEEQVQSSNWDKIYSGCFGIFKSKQVSSQEPFSRTSVDYSANFSNQRNKI